MVRPSEDAERESQILAEFERAARLLIEAGPMATGSVTVHYKHGWVRSKEWRSHEGPIGVSAGDG